MGAGLCHAFCLQTLNERWFKWQKSTIHSASIVKPDFKGHTTFPVVASAKMVPARTTNASLPVATWTLQISCLSLFTLTCMAALWKTHVLQASRLGESEIGHGKS